jgi:hypothetical protein
VTGGARIRQDLALALGEEVGGDHFHPEWGSVVIRYLGVPINDELIFDVKTEVTRVIEQYISNQNRILREGLLSQSRPVYVTDDIVVGVSDVDATVTFDTIKVTANLTTQSGRNLSISRTVNI